METCLSARGPSSCRFLLLGSEALLNGGHRRHADPIFGCGYATTDLDSYQRPKLWLKVIDSGLGSTRIPTPKRVSMKHPDTPCDCVVAASPLAFRWRCPACGKTTVMKNRDASCRLRRRRDAKDRARGGFAYEHDVTGLHHIRDDQRGYLLLAPPSRQKRCTVVRCRQ